LRCHNIAAVRDRFGNVKIEDGRVVIDNSVAVESEVAMSITALSGYELKPFPEKINTPEEGQALVDALTERRDIIRQFPPAIYDKLINCMKELTQYIQHVTDPQRLNAF
jgi:hypothetical protein